MRGLGSLLMVLGALVGVGASLFMLTGIPFPGLPWLITVGMIKLAFISSGGLIAAGAFVHRLGKRSDVLHAGAAGEYERLESGSVHPERTGDRTQTNERPVGPGP